MGMSVRRKIITAAYPVAEHNRPPKAKVKTERKKVMESELTM